MSITLIWIATTTDAACGNAGANTAADHVEVFHSALAQLPEHTQVLALKRLDYIDGGDWSCWRIKATPTCTSG